jgi:hypothetical protein
MGGLADAGAVDRDDPQAALAGKGVGQARLQATARPAVIEENRHPARDSVFIPSELSAVRSSPKAWCTAGWGIAQEFQRLVHGDKIVSWLPHIKWAIFSEMGPQDGASALLDPKRVLKRANKPPNRIGETKKEILAAESKAQSAAEVLKDDQISCKLTKRTTSAQSRLLLE